MTMRSYFRKSWLITRKNLVTETAQDILKIQLIPTDTGRWSSFDKSGVSTAGGFEDYPKGSNQTMMMLNESTLILQAVATSIQKI